MDCIDEMKKFILWARENGVVLGEVHIGDIHVSLSDPRVDIPAVSEPGPQYDDVDRTDSADRTAASNYYDQYARSRTPGKKP